MICDKINYLKLAIDRVYSRSCDDVSGKCSLEEATEKFREAMKKTKGKANTELALELSVRKNSTVDDIIRLGAYSGEGKVPDAYRGFNAGKHSRISGFDRKYAQRQRIFARVSDTIFADKIRKAGLSSFFEETSLSNTSMASITGEESRYWESERKQFYMLMDFTKASRENIIKYAPRYVREWSKDVNISPPNNIKGVDSQIFKLKRALLDLELTTINELPKETLERIQKCCNKPFSFAACYFGSAVPRTDYYCELANMFMESMKHMGLGVYCDWLESDRASTLPSFRAKGIVPLAKKAISVVKNFNSMVKKGFAPDLVRDEMILVLNEYARLNCKVTWKFVKRANAPTEYPELQVQKKSPKKTVNKVTKQETLEVGGLSLRIR